MLDSAGLPQPPGVADQLNDFWYEAESMLTPGNSSRCQSLSGYEAVTRERRLAYDLLDRVALLHYAIERLVQCSAEGIPGEHWGQEPCNPASPFEIRLLTEFVLHQLTSIAIVLYAEPWRVPRITGAWAYCVKCRDYFLSHPNPNSAIRRSARIISYERQMPAYSHPVHCAEPDPLLAAYYVGIYREGAETVLGTEEWDEIREMNRSLLLSGKRHERLTANEKIAMKLAGVPEPDIAAATKELAATLSQRILPEIIRIARKPSGPPSTCPTNPAKTGSASSPAQL